MVMPKIVIGPASYTLASHVAIFIAMMLSPAVAATVAVGTVLGFWISGLPPVIAFRAASHLVFAMIGSFYLQKHPETLASPVKVHVFSFLVAIVHSLCEVIVVFFLGGIPSIGAGEPLGIHSLLQAAGFIVLVLGSAMYHRFIKFPFFDYGDDLSPEAVASVSEASLSQITPGPLIGYTGT
jgi:hypothetical protein